MKYGLGFISMLFFSAEIAKALPNIVMASNTIIEKTTTIATQPTDSSDVKNTQSEISYFVLGIDIFGTEQITTEQVRQAWGEKIIRFAEAIYEQNSIPKAEAEELYEEIVTGIKAMGDFAYVDLSAVMYFEEGNPIYVTVDIVDAANASVRMPFRSVPTGKFSDPDRLLQQWEEYEETGFALSREGELKGYKNCPALHCTAGFEHPQLQKFLPIFQAGVRANRDRLVQILQEDRDETHRGNAVFLLAFTDDPASYVKTIAPAIRDSSGFVRNNVLRALIDIAREQPDIEIPVELVVEALRYPETTDRNKAAYILVELAKQPKYRQLLMEQAVPILLDMLKLEQPNNHDPAYKILTILSGEQYGERDYAAWERWAEDFSNTDASE